MELQNYIDGARILKVSESGNYGFVDDELSVKEIHILAICKYEDSPEFYLFACDSSFNVLGDTVHESEEIAMEEALDLYDQQIIKWR
jgi:hypothetical protein